MDYTEIIEREATKYAREAWGDHFDTIQKDISDYSNGENTITDYKNAINSPLAKQIAEIEKLEAKIEALMRLGNIDINTRLWQRTQEDIFEYQQQRDNLVEKLKNDKA